MNISTVSIHPPYADASSPPSNRHVAGIVLTGPIIGTTQPSVGCSCSIHSVGFGRCLFDSLCVRDTCLAVPIIGTYYLIRVPLAILALFSSFVPALAGPALQDKSILPYVPSATAAYTFGIAYGIVTLCLLFHTVRNRAWWTLCLPIGAGFMAIGFFLRIPVRTHQTSHGLVIPMSIFIVVSPAAFLAFNYLVYGHLIVAVDGSLADRRERRAKSLYSLIPPRLVKHIFVWSDISTFFVQIIGGTMEASVNTEKVGDRILLVGIILQGLSYIFFTVLSIHAFRRLRAKPSDPTFLKEGNIEHPARVIFVALWFSSVFILIRSVYRMVELGLGYRGTLYTHERYFLIFDSAPLFLAISIYVIVWPSTLLNEVQRRSTSYKEQGYPMTSTT